MDPLLAIMASPSRAWDSIADDLRLLGIDSNDPQKVANALCPASPNWLAQFEGTPLLSQALELMETELELESEAITRRQENDQRDIYTQQDAVRVAKSRLELELVKSRSAAPTAPTAPAAPPSAQSVTVKTTPEPKMAGEITYGGSYNTGESGTPVWPQAAMGDGAGRKETKEERAAREMMPPTATVPAGPGSNPKLAYFREHAEREADRARRDEKVDIERSRSPKDHLLESALLGGVAGSIPGDAIGRVVGSSGGALIGRGIGGLLGAAGGAYLGHQAGAGRRGALKMIAEGKAPDEHTPFWVTHGHDTIIGAEEDARFNRNLDTLGRTGSGRVVGESLAGALVGSAPGMLVAPIAPHVGLPLAAGGALLGGALGGWHGHRSAKARKEVEAARGWTPEQANQEVEDWDRKHSSLTMAVEGLRGLPFTS